MIPDLRPRGIGEILDAAVTLYKSRFGQLVRYAAIIVVPVQLFLTLVLLSAQPDSFNVNVTGGATPQFDTGKAQLAAFVVVIAVNFLTHAFVAAVTTKIVADEYVGYQEPAGQAARSAFRRFLAVLAVSLLVTFSAIIGLFACLVGAFAAEAVFAVAVPVVILERRRVLDAMGRSFELTKSHFWHVLGVVLAASLLTGLLNAAFNAGLNLWSSHGGGTTAIVIAHGLANTIAAMITAPFTAAAIVTLYFDLRIRDEAFDVQMALAGMRSREPVDPDAARSTAQHIVSGRQYRSAPTPRPFRGPLNWLGDRLHGIGHWFDQVLSHVPDVLVLVGAIAIVAAAITYAVVKARARGVVPSARRSSGRADDQSEDPVELERLASAAEGDGDLDRALRLRFRAGLLRLGDRGAIHYRPSLTTNEVRRALGSESFDELARAFESVAYGGRDAAPPDIDAARRAWPQVVANATPETDD